MLKNLWSQHALSIFLVLVFSAWVWGDDIWASFADRRENTHLRAEACERMVTLGYIAFDSEGECLNRTSVYHDGLAAAVFSQTSRIQAKVTAEIDQVDAVTASISATQFTPITMSAFLELYKNSKFPNRQVARPEPEQIVLEAAWIMITGYGGVRVEMPTQTTGHSSSEGVGLSLADNLDFLRGGMLDTICARTHAALLRCSGSVYIVVTEGALDPYYTVVGIELAQILPEHIFWSGLEILMPPFHDGSIKWQNLYMQKFLDAFPESLRHS